MTICHDYLSWLSDLYKGNCNIGKTALILKQSLDKMCVKAAITRAPSQYKDSLSRYGIPMLKIRRLQNRLIFNIGISILLRQHLYIETAPRFLNKLSLSYIHTYIHVYINITIASRNIPRPPSKNCFISMANIQEIWQCCTEPSISVL